MLRTARKVSDLIARVWSKRWRRDHRTAKQGSLWFNREHRFV